MDSETVGNFLNEEAPPTAPKADNVNTDDTDKKRSELINAVEDGEIEQSVRHIKKASAKVIEKLYTELESIYALRKGKLLPNRPFVK